MGILKTPYQRLVFSIINTLIDRAMRKCTIARQKPRSGSPVRVGAVTYSGESFEVFQGDEAVRRPGRDSGTRRPSRGAARPGARRAHRPGGPPTARLEGPGGRAGRRGVRTDHALRRVVAARGEPVRGGARNYGAGDPIRETQPGGVAGLDDLPPSRTPVAGHRCGSAPPGPGYLGGRVV